MPRLTRQEVELLRFLRLMNRQLIVCFMLLLLSMTTLAACMRAVKPSVFEPGWMTYDTTKKQVRFELIAAWNANNNGYNYNGYYQGDAVLIVPENWQVSITLINWDGNAPHSIIVTNPFTEDNIPDELTGEFSILKRAYTDSVYANESVSIKFIAKVGDYWLFCGEKGHGINGQWIKLKVDTRVRTPVIAIKTGLIDVRR